MTPCGASKRSLLAARDARQAALERCAAAGAPSLVALSLAIPGAEKAPPGSAALFAWGEAELERAVPGLRPLYRCRDALGPFAVFAAAGEPAGLKARCVGIEGALFAARLLDLDVYGPGLASMDRAALGRPPRACLCCPEPARDCIRAGRHSFPELVARARELLQAGPGGPPRTCAGGPTDRLAAALANGLLRELRLTPKPGLVDEEDNGSHPDLTFPLMQRSVALVAEYLRDLATSLAHGEPLASQVALGRAAERRMLAELGANTHKGAIFLCGLLLVARHRAGEDHEPALRRAVAELARELAGPADLPALRASPNSPAASAPSASSAPRASPGPQTTHGADARHRFGVGGILREAAAGLPSLFEVALPALRAARRAGAGEERAAFATLAALMQSVEDTTALHRCGLEGLDRLRQDGAALAALLAAGRDHHAFLRARNEEWRRLNLTMGGVADLLGLALGWLAYAAGSTPEATASPG